MTTFSTQGAPVAPAAAPGAAPTGPTQALARLPWPEGWHRPRMGGWPRIVLFVVFGLLCLAIGPLVLLSGEPGAGMAVGMTAFGVVMCASVPNFWPVRRGTPFLDRVSGGLVVPYSKARMIGSTVGCLGFAVTGAAMALAAEDPVGRVVGGACALLFAAFGLLLLVRRGARHGRLLLTPEGIDYGYPGHSARLAWEHVREVVARDQVTRTKGGRVYHPYIGIKAYDPAQVQADEGRIARTLRRLQRGYGDIMVAVPQLAVPPELAYWTLAFYWVNPALRGELADERGVHRALTGAFGPR